MIKLLITIAVLALFSGCSSRNAFSQFDLKPEQELSVSSLLSNKITSKDGKVQGVVSAIYLNDIYPDSFHNNEYFFVYIFLKDKKQMHDPKLFDNLELSLKLNDKLPMKIKQLPHQSSYSDLAFIKSDWNKYYLVAFEKQEESTINLVLESGQSSSGQLTYEKGQE